MHYKEKHTDKELLESGWLQMHDRLDREMPEKKESDKWYFLAVALLMLLGSVLCLYHNHEVEPNAIVQKTTQRIDKVLPNEKQAIQSVNQPNVSENLRADKSAVTPQKVKEQDVKQEIAQPTVINHDLVIESSPTQIKNAANSVQPTSTFSKVNSSRHTTALTQTKQQSPSPSSQDILRNANLNLPLGTDIGQSTLPPSLAGDNTLGKFTEWISLSSVLPIENIDLLVPQRSLPNAETELPRLRTVTPFISLGVLRSFTTEATGLHIGFGLHQQIKSTPKLSIKYLLSTNYLPSTYRLSFGEEDQASNVLSDVPDIEEEEVFNGPEEDTNINPVSDIDTYYQVSASVVGYYRLHPRFSIGLGGSLTYQDFKLSSRVDVLQIQRDNIDIYTQFAGTAYLSAPMHLTPRLSLEPYYQYQLTSGDIKVNQVGLNLTFGLTR